MPSLPRRLTALILPLFLANCAQGVSSACPALVDYPPATQARAADELAALAPGAVIAGMIADYGVLRNEVRACRATQ